MEFWTRVDSVEMVGNGQILDVSLGLADWWNVGWERRRKVKDNIKVLVISNWKKAADILSLLYPVSPNILLHQFF
jgi:hypothetical protein